MTLLKMDKIRHCCIMKVCAENRFSSYQGHTLMACSYFYFWLTNHLCCVYHIITRFWDAKGIVLIEDHQKGHVINEAVMKGYQDQTTRGTDERGFVLLGQSSTTQVFGFQWLLCMARALNWLTAHRLYSSDLAPPNNMKKYLAGNQCSSGDGVINSVDGFFWPTNMMKSSSPMGSKHRNTSGRSLCTAGETVLEISTILVPFCESTSVILWTVKPTLVVGPLIL